MRTLWTLALSLLAAPAFAGAYAIDPIASLPYVDQQVAPTAANPQFTQLSTFAVAAPDNACADLGWKFTFVNVVAGQAPGQLPLASLSLWMKDTNGQCVWTSSQQAEPGTSDGSNALNAFIYSGRLLTVDSAVNLARAAVPATLAVTSIVLDAEAGADGLLAPTYTVGSDLCFDNSAIKVGGFDGQVAARAPIDACYYKANLLMAEHVLTGLSRSDVRVYRDGAVLYFTDAAVSTVATLSSDRIAQYTALVEGVQAGPLSDVTSSPQPPCQVNTPDQRYEIVHNDGALIPIAEARADCHVLLLQQVGASELKTVLDQLLALGPTFPH